MRKPFLSRPIWLFGNVAVLVLCMVFFLVPFAMRGARMSVAEMKNDVKDWLPSDFKETKELDWFKNNFLGEQFVLITWEGCEEGDPHYELMIEKLRAETKYPSLTDSIVDGAPAIHAEPGDEPETPPSLIGTEMTPEFREELRAKDWGDKLGLYLMPDAHQDWGGKNEKWLMGKEDKFYYVLPNGELYRWHGKTDALSAMGRVIAESTTGIELNPSADEFVAHFGKTTPEGQPNPFHQDLRKLTARLFKTFYSGPTIAEQLTHPPTENGPGGPLWPRFAGSSDQEKAAIANDLAMERLKGSLFGPDGKQTAIVVTLTQVAKDDFARVCGRATLGKPQGKLYDLAQECGLATPPPPSIVPPPISLFLPEPEQSLAPEVHLGGPPVDNVAIDEEGTVTLVRLVSLCAAVGLGLAYLIFRSVKVTLMVFFVGGVSAAMSMGIVWWGGSSADAVLMSMPALVYVLGLSGAIHLVNYYREAVEEGGVEGAAERAMGHGWFPGALAAFTTSLGLISLYVSNLTPIKKFGLFSAIGVLATLLLLFTYMPAALVVFPPKFRITKGGAAAGFHRYIEAFWRAIGKFVIRRNGWVTVGLLLVTFVFAYGLTQIRTSVQLLKLFDPSSKVISDYVWLEENLGELTPLELVVVVPPELQRPSLAEMEVDEDRDVSEELFQLDQLERLELTSRIHEAVVRRFGDPGEAIMGPGLSAATLGPPRPSADGGVRSERGTTEVILEESRADLLATDYLRIDASEGREGNELWRISLRVGALVDVDYGDLVRDLKGVVEPVVYAYRTRHDLFRTLAEKDPEGSFLEKKILLLGVDSRLLDDEEAAKLFAELAPEPRVESALQGFTVPWAEKEVELTPTVKLHQTYAFVHTLTDLLRNRGYRTNPRLRSVYAVHDPVKFPIDDSAEKREQWDEYVANFDAVVLVDQADAYDLDALCAKAPVFVDGTGHRFYPEQSITAAERAETDPHSYVRVVYTGVVPVVYKAQRTLLTSLIESNALSFLMIAAVMMVLLRNWHKPVGLTNGINVAGGMIAMLPNTFPVVMIFGIMGYSQTAVDIGSMMCASVAMGIAVDDTIHFLNWYRIGLSHGYSRHQAILNAYKRCASAMTQTTIVGGLGLAIFSLSTFTPTQRFGTIMLCLLVAALVGDLIFLPALLAGPLGRFFGKPAETRRGWKHVHSSDDAGSSAGGPDGKDRVATNVVNDEAAETPTSEDEEEATTDAESEPISAEGAESESSRPAVSPHQSLASRARSERVRLDDDHGPYNH